MNDSDHELMRRAALGDAAAFTLLVRRWEGRVSHVLARLVYDRHQREDLCQEVFLHVLQAKERYRPQSAFSTWLYRIVLNVARDAARRRRRRQRVQAPEASRAAIAEGADAVAQEHELQRHIAEALDALPQNLREALVLKHFGDLTFAQIADLTQTPVSTVKSRVQKGLVEMRRELARRGIFREELFP